MRTRLVVLLVVLSGTASASPTIPLDDPVYDDLARLRALGRIRLYSGGIRPLTEYRAQQLLIEGGEPPNPTLVPVSHRSLWFSVARRVTLRLALFSDEERPYSTPDRLLGVIGGIEVSCEHQAGRPCGQGGGGLLELDSAAGWGHWISAFARLQFKAGSNQWQVVGAVDRLYLNGEVGPVGLLIGRDTLALGPGVHTQLIWGDNAPSFDHVRIQTSHPVKIPRIPVSVTALYAFGLLRDPQTYHDTQVTLTRIELSFADQLELAAQQLLQLNGDGAAHYGFGQFIGEHFTRTKGADATISNRRDSLEAVYTNRWARGLRIYYELAFEDFRKHLVDMFLYDCDHLIGFEMPALSRSGRHGFVAELQHNGPFSQEHTYYTTGTTNAGRVVGAPLGPDSWSLYASGRVDFRRYTLWPWFEWARLSSDTYNAIAYGPILVLEHRTPEYRYRFGVRARMELGLGFRLEGRALYEHVANYQFMQNAARDNGGVELSVVWTPVRH